MAKKYTERKMSLEEAVSTAFAEIESLGEEMREAYDNTPESLQQSGVGELRGAAADALEYINEVDVPDDLKDTETTKFEVSWNEPARTAKQVMKLSRSSRMGDACMLLDACIEFLDGIIEDEQKPQELRDSAEGLRGELDNAKSEAEAVEFPGMFG